jgi:hypothetical protein
MGCIYRFRYSDIPGAVNFGRYELSEAAGTSSPGQNKVPGMGAKETKW